MRTSNGLLRTIYLLAFVPTLALCAASTDSLQDADGPQSGYLPNHNLHPATVGSAIFGQLWKNVYNPLEDWYAKPLVLTPSGSADSRELVLTASNQNIVRIIDGLNGTLVNSRTIQPPFLQSDIGCGDIPNYIGIIGTPIIDPTTETVYFFSKGYNDGASSGGVLNGRYSFYAIDFTTLQDKPGFPVLIDGHYANNDPTRYFVGGTVLQRPSLTMLNGVVIGGFGGHCDLYNYTGMVVAVSKTPGVGVTGIFAMESSPGAPTPQPLDYLQEDGGKAGIWQSGMGIATDGISRIFFNTGNGQGHQNGNVPASGRVPLSTLDETVVNMKVVASGTLPTFSLTDYFEPFEYVNMDAADRDLGSGGVCLLDPTVFAAPEIGVSRIAVAVGKNGKTYIMDANQLGGFKQGPQGTDGVLQTITAQNAVFGGPGSYPLEGGYIYFTPVGQPTVCYKFTVDPAGKPVFVFVGQSAVPSAGRVGVGIPTITTYKGQAGTGILWITDVNLGLRAFKAVPENQVLVPINLPATPGLGKFGRPGFGNGRVYITTRSTVFCLGSPVALPLSCTQPVDFGGVAIGDIATVNITCTALIALIKVNGCVTQDQTFQCKNSTLPTGPLAKGATFTFPVVWNLTQSSINDAQNASYGHVLPGVTSTVLDLYTTNNAVGYSTDLPISISGTTISRAPFLAIAPQELDFGGIVIGSGSATSGLEGAIIVSNLGSQLLTFTGFSWEDATEDSAQFNLTTASDGSKIIGNSFTSSSFPDVGSTIAVGSSITIPLLFKTNIVGSYSSILTLFSNGGNQDVLFVGSASTSPIANISVSTQEGGWDDSTPLIMEFGTVLAGTTAIRSIRLCNEGGSPMSVTKSKPPTQGELGAIDPNIDLHEGQSIPVNSCALGPVRVAPPGAIYNRSPRVVSDVWILNTDGLNSDLTPFGVHEVAITANVVTKQIGPLLPNGTARYQYLGCYSDGAGRQLATKLSYTTAQQNANENGQCQTDCFAKGYAFAGTEYHVECWCGNVVPSSSKLTTETDHKCAFNCPGDSGQSCGGDGTYLSVYYDLTKYNPITGPVASSSVKSSSSSTSLPSSSSSSRSSSSPASSLTITSNSPSTSTKPTSSVSPSPTASLGSFTYVGCYAEPTSGPRALTLKVSIANMTNEYCADLCAASTYFGTEYTKECYCGNALATGAVPASQTDCKLACSGNKNEICGGSLRLSVYKKSAPGVSSSSQLSSTRSVAIVSLASTLISSSASQSPSQSTSVSTSQTLSASQSADSTSTLASQSLSQSQSSDSYLVSASVSSTSQQAPLTSSSLTDSITTPSPTLPTSISSTKESIPITTDFATSFSSSASSTITSAPLSTDFTTSVSSTVSELVSSLSFFNSSMTSGFNSSTSMTDSAESMSTSSSLTGGQGSQLRRPRRVYA